MEAGGERANGGDSKAKHDVRPNTSVWQIHVRHISLMFMRVIRLFFNSDNPALVSANL